MKIRINNEADLHAFAQVASLQNPRSVLAIISAASARCSTDEDFQAEVAKDLLAPSYHSNPSILAIKIQATTQFADSSGFQTPNRPTHVTILLHRQAKLIGARYTRATPSIKSTTKAWLKLDLKHKRLHLPHEAIPPFFQTHPEQFVYQIKTETNMPIKILKLSKSWLISRK